MTPFVNKSLRANAEPEAESIEKVLTKDQLKQLREIRQNAPPSVMNAAANTNVATKTE